MAKQLNVNLAFTADTSQAKAQIQDLQNSLKQVSSMSLDMGSIGKTTQQIQAASNAAANLSVHLRSALNQDTGRLDFAKLNQSIKQSGGNLQDYASTIRSIGPEGEKAFLKLARVISSSEVPIRRSNQLINEMWTTMKNTARWQLSSSVLHGFMGTVQSAYHYAENLNESLNNIRIVTGYNTQQMSQFAKEANKSAKALSTTTTQYTNASLIYYQQGLSDEEVKKRTDITVKMANVSRESAQVVSDQMTAVWNNFAKGGENLEYYADVMTALGAKTASSTAEISAGLEKFAAIAETVGLSYEYATASLATITATTRQSADVVGNALKTLFARIQGLSLGETLEDGVDLNKYSKALDAVGVKVLDANGQIRDMDDILDDLASKWKTIGKAEQTALAQTVAGVRQYTQLIALMENWDFMQENLQTAYDSSGALQGQADIYAESWEAASNRVRAAAEDIFDSLLNDKFFINILNGFEGILNTVGNLVDSLGGMQGVLMATGVIFTKVFSSQMQQGLQNMVYNLKMSTKYGQQQEINERLSFLSQSNITDENTSQKTFASEAYRREMDVQKAFLNREAYMSEIDKEQARNRIDLLQQANEKSIKAGEEYTNKKNITVDRYTEALGTLIREGVNTGKAKEYLDKLEEGTQTYYKEKKTATQKFAKDGERKVYADAMLVAEGFIDTAEDNALKAITDDDIRAKVRKIFEKYEDAYLEELEAKDKSDTASDDADKKANEARSIIDNAKDISKTFEATVINTINSTSKVLMGMSALGNIKNVFEAPDMTGWEKALSIFTSLSIGLPALMTGAKGLGKTFTTVKDFAKDGGIGKTLNTFNKVLSFSQRVKTGFKEKAEDVLNKEIENRVNQEKQRREDDIKTLKDGTVVKKEGDDYKLGHLNKEGQFEQDTSLGSKGHASSDTEAGRAIKKEYNKQQEEHLEKYREDIKAKVQGLADKVLENAEGELEEGSADAELVKKLREKLSEARGEAGQGAADGETINSLDELKEMGKIILGVAKAHPYLTAAITAGTVAITAASKAWVAHEEAVAEAAEQVAETTAIYQQAVNATKSFKDSSSNYESAVETLRDLKTNSQDYAEAMEDANDKARELIETYGLYGKTTVQNGLITFTEDKNGKTALDEVYAELRKNESFAEMQKYNALYEESQAVKNRDIVNFNRETFGFGALTTFGAYDEMTGYVMLNKQQKIAVAETINAFENLNDGTKNLNEYLNETLPSDIDRGLIDSIVKNKEEFSTFGKSLEKITEQSEYHNTELKKALLDFKDGEKYDKLATVDGEIDYALREALLSADAALMGDNVLVNDAYDKSLTGWNFLDRALGWWNGVDWDDYYKKYAEKTGAATSSELTGAYREGTTLKNSAGKIILDDISYDKVYSYIDAVENPFIQLGAAATETADALSQLGDILGPFIMGLTYDQVNTGTTNDTEEFSDEDFKTKFNSDLELIEKATGLDLTHSLANVFNKQSDGQKVTEDDISNLFTRMTKSNFDNLIKTRDSGNLSSEAQVLVESLIEAFDIDDDEKFGSEEQSRYQEAFDIKGKSEAETLGIDSQQYENYLNTLYLGNEEMRENAELANNIALSTLKTSQSQATINELVKQSGSALTKASQALKNGAKFSDEIANNLIDVDLESLQEATANLLGFEKDDVDQEFAVKYFNEIQKAAQGATDDIQKLYELYFDYKFGEGFFENLPKDVKAQLENISKEIEPFNLGDVITFDSNPSMYADILSTIGNLAAGIAAETGNITTAWDSAVATVEGMNNIQLPQIELEQIEGTIKGVDGFDPVPGQPIVATVGPHGETATLDSWQYVAIPGENGSYTYHSLKINGKGGIGVKGDTPGKTGGGGGGGGKKASIRQKSEAKRYHRQKNKIEDVSKEYDRIGKAVDRAYGKDKLNKIDAQSKALEKQIALQKDLVNAIELNVEPDKQKMLEEWDKLREGTNLGELQIGSDGNLLNWSELQEDIIDLWNTMTADEQEKFKEQEGIFKGYLELYEETHDLLIDEKDKLQELLNTELDLKLQKIQYEVEMKIEISEDSLKYLEYQLEKIEDDAYAAADAIALINAQLSTYLEEIEVYQKGIKDILKTSFENDEQVQAALEKILAGDYSVLQGITFTNDQVQELRDYANNLLDINQTLIELKSDVFEKLSDAFDDWVDKLDTGIEKVEHYGNILNSFKNIVNITGKEVLGITNALMKDLNSKVINNAMDNLAALGEKNKAIQQQVLNVEESLKQAEQKLLAAEASGVASQIENAKKDVQYWTEMADSVNEEARSTTEDLLSAWEAGLEAVMTKFTESIEVAFEDFNKAIYENGGLEGLSSDFEKQKENSEAYLKDYEKVYELSKLTRQINKSIDDTKSIAGKQKLKSLLQDINKINEENLEMSKYDLEYMQKEYDLRLAQIALEEAQNAKNTVRLQKDSEGNYSYVYTANQEAIDEAQQKYEDILYEMQELTSQHISDMSQSSIEATQQMEAELSELYKNANNYTEEELKQKEKDIIEHYQNKIDRNDNEINKAIQNNQSLYEADIKNWEYATGQKQIITDDFVTSYKDSILGMLMGSDSEVANFGAIVGETTTALKEALHSSYAELLVDVNKMNNTAGVEEEFSKMLAGAIEKVGEKSTDAASDVKSMKDDMITYFDDLIPEVNQFAEDYAKNIQPIIDKNIEIRQTILDMIKAYSEIDRTPKTTETEIETEETVESIEENEEEEEQDGNNNNRNKHVDKDGDGYYDDDGAPTPETIEKAILLTERNETTPLRNNNNNDLSGQPYSQEYLEKNNYLAPTKPSFNNPLLPLKTQIENPWITYLKVHGRWFLGMDSGGYTGDWGDSSGRLAMLHKKELVLNAEDTENMLSAVQLVRNLVQTIDLNARQASLGIGALYPTTLKEDKQILQQEVHITAEFPNVQNKSEIEEAFNSLINTASQYANRKF